MQLLTRKFTVTEYQKMAEVGILTEEDRVELINGKIIPKSPIGLKHAAKVKKLNSIFHQKIDNKTIISVQDPIQLNDNSEPQLDIALLKHRADFYASKIPQPRDIFLIVEVADTSIKYDREIKDPLYGKNGILETWLIDINSQRLLRCATTEPALTDGQSLTIYSQTTSVGYQSIKTRASNRNNISCGIA